MGSIFPLEGFGRIVTFLGSMYSLKGESAANNDRTDFFPLYLVAVSGVKVETDLAPHDKKRPQRSAVIGAEARRRIIRFITVVFIDVPVCILYSTDRD